MNDYNKSEKKSKSPLCTLQKANPLKRKQTLKNTKAHNDGKIRKENNDGKANSIYNGSTLTTDELALLWINFKTHGHFRVEKDKVTSETSKGKLDKNLAESEKYFNEASNNSQSVHIVSTNTWNWAKVTQVNQSDKNLSEINSLNLVDRNKEKNNFIELLTNEERSLQEKTFNPSNTVINDNKSLCDNNSVINNYLRSLEPDINHESVSSQFNLDEYKENVDPNIPDNFDYNNLNNNENHENISTKWINIDQNNFYTNSNDWYDNNENGFQSLEAADAQFPDYGMFNINVYDNQSALEPNDDYFIL